MSHEIFMPALSSTMTEGKIVEWLKNPGDKVERGESVLVVESDKADMDVESFQDGFLAAVLMPAGSTAPVGETIGIIVETEDEITSVQKNNKTFKIQSDENKKDIQSENKNEEVSVKSVKTLKREEPKIKKIEEEIIKNDSQIDASTTNSTSRVIASPKAKKLASQNGVDLTKVRGTGPHGRIQAEDVLKAKGQPISVPWIGEGDYSAGIINNKEVKSISKEMGNSFGKPGETVQFNTLQKAVNKNMESSLDVPCFRVGYSIKTQNLDNFYKKVKQNGVTMTATVSYTHLRAHETS